MSTRRATGIGAAALLIAVVATLSGCTGNPDAAPASDAAAASAAAGSTADAGSTGGTGGDGAGSPGPETAPTVPAPTPAIPAYTVEQLRQTIVDSGYTCTTFTAATIDTGTGGAGTGGWCVESSLGVFVFPKQSDVDALLARSAASSEPQPFLVGTRWVMTSNDPAGTGDELVGMQDIIGGSLVGPDL